MAGNTNSNTIAPGGVGTIGSLSIGGLTTTGLTTLDFDLGIGAGEVTSGDLLTLGSGTVSVGSGTLMAFGGSPVGGNDYRLIGGSVSGINLADFTLPTAPSGVTYSLSSSVDSGYIDLVVVGTGPASLTWTDSTNNHTWDAVSGNWTSGAIYADGANVTFDDSSGAGHYAVTLNTSVSPGSIIVNNSAGNYSISGGGSIGGTGSLTKSGTGMLTLSTPNTYSGGTNVTAGLLVIAPNKSHDQRLADRTGQSQRHGRIAVGVECDAGQPVGQSSHERAHEQCEHHVVVDHGRRHARYCQQPRHHQLRRRTRSDRIDRAVDCRRRLRQRDHSHLDGDRHHFQPAQSNPNYGVGYADAADVGDPAGLASGEIEIMYTLLGDANLDGKVNGTDFNLMATNFNQAVTNGWDEGDFNYDGKVNGSDFVLLADNFNQFASESAVASADLAALDAFAGANGVSVGNGAGAGSGTGAGSGISLTNVPEPASTGLLTIGAISVLARRRRKVTGR